MEFLLKGGEFVLFGKNSAFSIYSMIIWTISVIFHDIINVITNDCASSDWVTFNVQTPVSHDKLKDHWKNMIRANQINMIHTSTVLINYKFF